MKPLGWSQLDPKKHADKRKHKVRSRYLSQSLSSEEDRSSVHMQRSSKPSRAPSDQDQPQHNPDPPFSREVAMVNLPSQYAEEMETFRRILDLPDPRETMPRLSTSVLGLDDKRANRSLGQEARLLCSPLALTSKMSLISLSMIFWPIKPPPSTAKWYKVGQPCYEDKIQELNTDFSKICISPKPYGPYGQGSPTSS